MYIDNLGNKFTWDGNKEYINQGKHNISFKEASTVFLDEDAVIFSDDAHSIDEERFIIVGFSDKERMLFVCHCYRDDGDTIRIISARKATRLEHKLYHN